MRGESLRPARAADYERIAEIYNSNPAFLCSHLGMESVDEAFIAGECGEMRRAGFEACVIEDGGQAVGVLDYRSGEEAYLSLLMLHAGWQGQGMGSRVYAAFETQMITEGAASIRIDVVKDYPGNLEPFWKMKGFWEEGEITLVWGNRKSRALVMRKGLK